MSRGRPAALAALLLAAAAARADDTPPLPIIAPQVLAAHMRFLADDLLEGRATGSDGYRIAARYVAAQMEAAGLQPAGTDGYLQPVPLRAAEVDGRRSWVRLLVPGLATAELRHGEQALIAPSFLRAQDDLDAAVVFVGYGITAPELGHDDYAGVDVRGKAVAVLSGAPTGFPDVLRAHHSGPAIKAETAATHGAVGLLVLATPEEQKRFPWQRRVHWAGAPAMRWVHGQEVEGALPGLHGTAVLGLNAADRLLAGGGRTPSDVYARAAAGEHVSFETGGHVALRTVTRHRSLESPNVAALLPGADPQLRAETVVFSAHLDHLGVGEAVDGDRIYNGAVDNASGVAALIAIAQALAALPQPPRRSVLFLAVTGEEQGLLGSDYFAHYPTVRPDSIVADLNLDCLGLMLPSADVVGIGSDSSTLGDTLRRAAARLGVEVSPDPAADQVLFIRSDQYSFVRRGVPAVFLNAGFKPLQPGRDLDGAFHDWLKNVYHSPKDDLSQPLDLAAGARLARLNLALGMMVANEAERPRWRADDFFGRTYGHPKAPASVPAAPVR